MNDASIIQLLSAQLQILWLYLQRPTVQVQIAAVVLTILIAALVTQFLRWVVRRYLVPDVVAYVESDEEEESGQTAATTATTAVGTTTETTPTAPPIISQFRRWVYATQPLFLPIATLILLQILIPIMQASAQPLGLILAAQFLLVLFLAYRSIVALLYSRLRAKQAHFYDRFLLLPSFILVTFNLILYSLNLRGIISDLPFSSFFGLDLTINGMVNFILIIYFAFALSRLVQDALRHIVHRRIDLDSDIERSIVNLGRNITIGIGIVIALGSLGVSLTALTFVAGGLSVGIGTGLSTIASNLVSGFLLWSDDTVRLGDVIQINNEMGTVEKMGIRSTIVRTFDNVELIVPNENFMTQVVVAFTKSSRIVRVTVNIGVGYGTNGADVRDLLLDIAKEHGLVKNDPEPIVFFDGFGASSLDFRLLVWVDDPLLSARVRSDLHYMILRRFRERGIEIPFPQRDVHLSVGNWPEALTRPRDIPSQPQLTQEEPPQQEEM